MPVLFNPCTNLNWEFSIVRYASATGAGESFYFIAAHTQSVKLVEIGKCITFRAISVNGLSQNACFYTFTAALFLFNIRLKPILIDSLNPVLNWPYKYS